MFTDYYAVLEIDPSASAAEVRRAFKQMALRCHPDKMIAPMRCDADGPDGTRHAPPCSSCSYLGRERAHDTDASRAHGIGVPGVSFAEVQEAYEVLSDVARRYLYDLNYAELAYYRQQQQQQQEIMQRMHKQMQPQRQQELFQRRCREEAHERSVAATRRQATTGGESEVTPTRTRRLAASHTATPEPTVFEKECHETTTQEPMPPVQPSGVRPRATNRVTDSVGGAREDPVRLPVIGQASSSKGEEQAARRAAEVAASVSSAQPSPTHSGVCEGEIGTHVPTHTTWEAQNDAGAGSGSSSGSSPLTETGGEVREAADGPPSLSSRRVALPVLHMPTASITFTPCAKVSRQHGRRVGAVGSGTVASDRSRADRRTMACCQKQSVRKTITLFLPRRCERYAVM